MKNVKIERSKDNKLVITIDLTKNYGESSSGKSIIIATTAGNMPVGDNMYLGLNVYQKIVESEKPVSEKQD